MCAIGFHSMLTDCVTHVCSWQFVTEERRLRPGRGLRPRV